MITFLHKSENITHVKWFVWSASTDQNAVLQLTKDNRKNINQCFNSLGSGDQIFIVENFRTHGQKMVCLLQICQMGSTYDSGERERERGRGRGRERERRREGEREEEEVAPRQNNSAISCCTQCSSGLGWCWLPDTGDREQSHQESDLRLTLI
jgi:hypothetical protein